MQFHVHPITEVDSGQQNLACLSEDPVPPDAQHLDPQQDQEVLYQPHQVPKDLEPSISEKFPPLAVGEPKKASSQLNRPATKQNIQMRYSIIKSRTPLLSKRYWENGALQNKTVDILFAEISNLIGRPSIERMSFQLRASQSESGTWFPYLQYPKF